MHSRIDENGKVFTDRVHKERVVCIIQTATHRIRGEVFRDPASRIKDDWNNPHEAFIAVTNAEVLSPAGKVQDRSEFMMVNKQHIVWMLPASEEEIFATHGRGSKARDL